MLEGYKRHFLHKYSDADYLTQSRSKLLLAFETVFIILIGFLQFSMLFAGWEDFVKTLYITPGLIFGFVISLLFLRKGKYMTAANILISVSTVAVVAGLLREPFFLTDVAYSSYIFFVYPVIGMCIIFSTIKFLTVITMILAATNMSLFYIMIKVVHYDNTRQAIIAFTDSLFAMGFLYLIGWFTSRIFHGNITMINNESEKNQRHNNFITNVLRDGIKNIVTSMQEITDQSNMVSHNAQDQVSSIEEITGSIEEMSAGLDSVNQNVTSHDENINAMSRILDDLSKIIDNIDSSINNTLNSMEEIANRAQSGGMELNNMEQNMGAIKNRSMEMTDIVNIINDISDRINLLSLNAAIEAARAGDAGRGFAVVADEISKLADKTASSIKSIEDLIVTNEAEIEKGMAGLKVSVETIASIINDVNHITSKMRELSQYKVKQLETNRIANEQAVLLKKRSDEIATSAHEQKAAISEILRAVEHINGLSQSTSTGVDNISDNAGKLYSVVEEFRRVVEEYKDE